VVGSTAAAVVVDTGKSWNDQRKTAGEIASRFSFGSSAFLPPSGCFYLAAALRKVFTFGVP
jgi:hypothetical protein